MRLTDANALSSNKLPTTISSTRVAIISSTTPIVAPIKTGKKRTSFFVLHNQSFLFCAVFKTFFEEIISTILNKLNQFIIA